jgi:hypothetical protein
MTTMTISFESVGDYPNGYSITDEELAALYAIVISNQNSYDYDVTEARETGGRCFLVVEKRCPKYEYTQTYYRVDAGGAWGVLFEVPEELDNDTPSLVRRHVQLRVRMATHTFDKSVMDEDQQVVAELVRRGVLDT